jgi:hypothetical protein
MPSHLAVPSQPAEGGHRLIRPVSSSPRWSSRLGRNQRRGRDADARQARLSTFPAASPPRSTPPTPSSTSAAVLEGEAASSRGASTSVFARRDPPVRRAALPARSLHDARPGHAGSRLITGVTFGDSGGWTSWPPHQHERDLEGLISFRHPGPAVRAPSHREPGKLEAVHPVSSAAPCSCRGAITRRWRCPACARPTSG